MNMVLECESVVICNEEVVILKMILQGMSNRQIAQSLGYHHNSIKRKVATIYSKLGAVNRPHAIAIAMQKGLVKLDED